MIISRTPFRVSLAGGGTDLPAFYKRQAGAVLSTAIDKYMYVTVNKYFEDKIILKYSRTELVPRLENVRHPLLRECLRLVGPRRGVEVTSMADVVGGTGLGSSSSFTVGVLHALHAFKGDFCPASELAREACTVEIERVKEPIGKQDQYIAAFGGFQFIEFMPDGSVKVDPLICPAGTLENLRAHLLLVYSGIKRSAGRILKRVGAGMDAKETGLSRIGELARRARRELQAGRIEAIGDILRENWEIKRTLAGGVSNGRIDEAYRAALSGGASGGKILGAGGGGFLLLFCPPKKRKTILSALRGWREIPFAFEPEGSKIIYVSR
ncbi:MAG TPA: GHMP kinase [Elusimicrobiota bacterium]|nr:GHMP kinase [Elusimicrobiota bacterium]